MAATDDPQLLREVLEFLEQRRQEPSQPRRGSYEAFRRHRGTISPEEGAEVQRIIDQEFNKIVGEW